MGKNTWIWHSMDIARKRLMQKVQVFIGSIASNSSLMEMEAPLTRLTAPPDPHHPYTPGWHAPTKMYHCTKPAWLFEREGMYRTLNWLSKLSLLTQMWIHSFWRAAWGSQAKPPIWSQPTLCFNKWVAFHSHHSAWMMPVPMKTHSIRIHQPSSLEYATPSCET